MFSMSVKMSQFSLAKEMRNLLLEDDIQCWKTANMFGHKREQKSHSLKCQHLQISNRSILCKDKSKFPTDNMTAFCNCTFHQKIERNELTIMNL